VKVGVWLCRIAVLFAPISAAALDPPGNAKAAVSRLLDAVKTGDGGLYAELGPKLVMMAAPDFGVPISFDEARKAFGGCSLTSLSEPKSLDSVPASLVTATMTCGAPWPKGPLTFDFLADSSAVHGIYPGGFRRFYPDRKPAAP